MVIHGLKFDGGDPEMKPEGIAQIACLKENMPQNTPPQVWRGEGKRHGQVAKVLGLVPTHYSALFGPASSVERRPEGPVTVLPDGSAFAFKPDDAWIFRDSLIALIECDVAECAYVVAGREMLMALTGQKASEFKTGKYEVTVWRECGERDVKVSYRCVQQAPGNF